MAAGPGSQLAATLAACGVEGDAVAALVSELTERHAEPHRRYHTAEHVGEVLAEIDRLGGSLTPADRAGCDLAAHFHDAIYDVHASAGASEAASADLARERLEHLRVDAVIVHEVDRLVRLTAGHRVAPDDVTGAVLVDADLWILSSEPERYDRYAADVRVEYAHVPDELWVAGRDAVLGSFIESIDALYRAGEPADAAARRARAAANLARELDALGSAAG
jgi:predicted metal-dependent HD superfamily phosphohydrolase